MITGIAVIVIYLITLIIQDKINFTQSVDVNQIGTFGDFIGGFVGSLWALAGVFLFYQALVDQKMDFRTNIELLKIQQADYKEQLEESRNTRKILEQQREISLAQKFEDTFFNLLNNYITIIKSITIDENPMIRNHGSKPDNQGVSLLFDFWLAIEHHMLKQDGAIKERNIYDYYYSHTNLVESEYLNCVSIKKLTSSFSSIVEFIEKNKDISQEKNIYYKILLYNMSDVEKSVCKLYADLDLFYKETEQPIIKIIQEKLKEINFDKEEIEFVYNSDLLKQKYPTLLFKPLGFANFTADDDRDRFELINSSKSLIEIKEFIAGTYGFDSECKIVDQPFYLQPNESFKFNLLKKIESKLAFESFTLDHQVGRTLTKERVDKIWAIYFSISLKSNNIIFSYHFAYKKLEYTFSEEGRVFFSSDLDY